MKYLYLIGFVATFHNSHCQINLGDKLDRKQVQYEQMSLISAGSIEKVFGITLEQVKYEVAVTEEGVITYVDTNDKSFKTPENVRIDLSLKELQQIVGSAKIVFEPGWGRYVRLPSGWNAAFTYQDSFDEHSKVLFFFKRR